MSNHPTKHMEYLTCTAKVGIVVKEIVEQDIVDNSMALCYAVGRAITKFEEGQDLHLAEHLDAVIGVITIGRLDTVDSQVAVVRMLKEIRSKFAPTVVS